MFAEFCLCPTRFFRDASRALISLLISFILNVTFSGADTSTTDRIACKDAAPVTTIMTAAIRAFLKILKSFELSVENIETRDFLEKATNHLIRLTNSKVDTITCDLHPRFITTKLGKDLSAKNEWNLIQVQHHHSHVAALMMEHSLNEIVGIVCDGYGYGIDGEAWGGEILFSSRESAKFERVGHLEKQPLLGGDLSTRYPIRIAAGILNKEIDIYDTKESGV